MSKSKETKQPESWLSFNSKSSVAIWAIVVGWTLAAWRYGNLSLSDIKPLAIFVGEAVAAFGLLIVAFSGLFRGFSRGQSGRKSVSSINFHWLSLLIMVLAGAALVVLLLKLDWRSTLAGSSTDGWPYFLAGIFLLAQLGDLIGRSDSFKRAKLRFKRDKSAAGSIDQTTSLRTTSSSEHFGVADMLSMQD